MVSGRCRRRWSRSIPLTSNDSRVGGLPIALGIAAAWAHARADDREVFHFHVSWVIGFCQISR
jgi:hypothetical protein